MSNPLIPHLMQSMSLEELLILQEQVKDRIDDKRSLIDKQVKSSQSRTIKYRYKIRWGTITPKHMKKQVLQGNGSCMLGISLGSAKSEGDRFEASIRWISQHFSRCVLVLADSIYRYTFQVTNKVNIEAGRAAALKLGGQFVDDYQEIINRYRESCDFQWVKMSEIEQCPNFAHYHQSYQQLYHNDQQFHQQMNSEAQSYLSALADAQTLLHPLEKAQNIALSAEYFLEESAIFTCMCANGEHTLLYPGTIKPLQILSEGVMPGIPEPIRKLILVRLNQSTQTPYFSPPGKSDDTTYAPAYSSSILENLNDEEWSHILQYTDHRQFQAGDVLVQQGETARFLVILLKGNVEVISGDWHTGDVKQTLICGPISLFGERSFLEGYPVSKTLAALTDGEILLLTSRSLQKMVRRVPSTALHLLTDIARVLATRLVNVNTSGDHKVQGEW